MGLFDRIFSVGQVGEEGRASDTSEYAASKWESESAVREAIDRHHDAIERRLDQHARKMQSAAEGDIGGEWAAPVAGWDDHDGLEQVINRLQSHSDPAVRALAARTLAMMPGRRAMESLAEALHDPEVIVRDAARDALIKLGVATLLT